MQLQLRKPGEKLGKLERVWEGAGVCEAEVMLWVGELGGGDLLRLLVGFLGLCLKVCVSRLPQGMQTVC